MRFETLLIVANSIRYSDTFCWVSVVFMRLHMLTTADELFIGWPTSDADFLAAEFGFP